MKYKLGLLAFALFIFGYADAQMLWNTNTKWASPSGIQTQEIGKIDFTRKTNVLKSRIAANPSDTALNKKITATESRALDSSAVQMEKQAWFNADAYARKNPAVVSKYLQFFNKADTSIANRLLNLQSTDSIMKNVSYVILALQDSGDIQSYFDSLEVVHCSSNDSLQIRIAMADISALTSRQNPPSKGRFTAFLSGDFLTTLQNNNSTSNSNGSIATGSIAVNYMTANQRNIVTAKIILASTQDTVTNNYGTQILVPSKGKGFGTLSAGYAYRLSHLDDSLHPWALNLFVTGSSERWRLDSLVSTDSLISFTESASLASFDLTVSKSFLCPDSITVGSSKYALAFNLNAGFAERLLGGDVLKPIQTANSALKQAGYLAGMFPTKRNKFFGLEAGSSINFGPIMAEFEAYYFFPNAAKDIQPLYGLTGLQFSFGASINLNFYHN